MCTKSCDDIGDFEPPILLSNTNFTVDQARNMGPGKTNPPDFNEHFRKYYDASLRQFDGSCTDEAKRWLEDMIHANKFFRRPFVELCEFLLTEQARTLWTDVKEKKGHQLSDEEAIIWFKTTFMRKGNPLDDVVEWANMYQKEGEKFLTFEIRVRQAIDKVFELNKEECVQETLRKRISSKVLKQRFVFKPKMTVEDMREEAKILEDSQTVEEYREVAPVKKSFRDAVKAPNRNLGKKPYVKPVEYDRRPIIHNSSTEYTSKERYEKRSMNNNIAQDKRQPFRSIIDGRKQAPTHSAYHEARKLYCRVKQLPAPKEEVLSKGDCFCCGKHGHIRRNCPLNNLCLICGKSGHGFRNCFKLQQVNAMCVEKMYEDHTDEIVPYEDDVLETLNTRNSAVSISSVELA